MLAINRLLSLYIAGQRAWLISCGPTKQTAFLHQSTNDVVKRVAKEILLPAVVLGAGVAGLWYRGFDNLAKGWKKSG